MARRESNSSYADIGLAMGVKPEVIVGWEAGKTIPTKSQVNMLARFFGIGIKDFTDGVVGYEQDAKDSKGKENAEKKPSKKADKNQPSTVQEPYGSTKTADLSTVYIPPEPTRRGLDMEGVSSKGAIIPPTKDAVGALADGKGQQKGNKKGGFGRGDKVISFRSVTKQVGKRRTLSECSFGVYTECTTAVLCCNGVYEKEIMDALLGLTDIMSGSIRVFGTETSKLYEPHITKFRRDNISLILPSDNLISTLKVKANITLPLSFSGDSFDEDRYKYLTARFGVKDIQDEKAKKLTDEESVRVALVRGLISHDKIIVAHDPMIGLDEKAGSELLELLIIEAKRLKLPLVIVTRDAKVSLKCDIVHVVGNKTVQETIEKPTLKKITNVLEEIKKGGEKNVQVNNV